MSKNISSSLKYHYDEELFNNAWTSEKDPTSLVLLESGAMVEDPLIAQLISGGGNYFTLPFYKDIAGSEVNYDGATNITADDTEDGVQSGVVIGRAKGWKAVDFIKDFTGADPMRNILNRVEKYKAKQVQTRLIGILNAILGITGEGAFADWNNHKMNIADVGESAPTDANKIGATTLRDLAVQANGDSADDYALAIMHSVVANRLSQFNVLEYFKYNDARGQELDVKVGRSGNMIVLICDEVPHVVGDAIYKATSDEHVDATKTYYTKSGDEYIAVASPVDANIATYYEKVRDGAMEYTTFCLGRGVLLHANAPVERPSDIEYKASELGGTEYLYTRYRETIHPDGFTFAMDNMPISPLDSDLATTANWSIVKNPKTIAIAKLVSNG